MRVLMVEDDSDILDVTTYALRKYGYEVHGVSTAQLHSSAGRRLSPTWC